MEIFKLVSQSGYFKNYISFFLMFFFISNILVVKAEKNTHLNRNSQEENKLNEFYSQNGATFSQHDKLDSQLKMFLGFDPENPETSFFPDSLIIDDSDYIRHLYILKLNDMSIKK